MGTLGALLVVPLAVLAVAAVTALGLGAARASGSRTHTAFFAEGTILHSSFVTGRGVGSDGHVREISAEQWLRVGPGGEEDIQRATLKGRDGALLQEGIRRRVDGSGSTFLHTTGELFQTPRPQQLPVLMWTAGSVEQELVANGFRLMGELEVAGVPALVYEKRSALTGPPPEELLKATRTDLDDVVSLFRRVYIGNQPFGVDLGEEAGYILSDGYELTPYYRLITLWEVLDEAPTGAFEWSPAAALEMNR